MRMARGSGHRLRPPAAVPAAARCEVSPRFGGHFAFFIRDAGVEVGTQTEPLPVIRVAAGAAATVPQMLAADVVAGGATDSDADPDAGDAGTSWSRGAAPGGSA